MASTKIEMSFNKVGRMNDLDELAAVLLPGNRRHQRIFAAIYVELKWAPNQFLPVLQPIADQHRFSRRMLEIVRAKMRRMGLIDHVSRFNKTHGYREGWVFSNRFGRTLQRLAGLERQLRERKNPIQEKKDRDPVSYTHLTLPTN